MASVDPVEAWWRLWSARLLELRSVLPPALRGSIQFSSRREGRPPFFGRVLLAGGATSLDEGVLDEPEVWVEIDATRIGALLKTGAALDVFRISGRIKLWSELSAAIGQLGRPKSILDVRRQS